MRKKLLTLLLVLAMTLSLFGGTPAAAAGAGEAAYSVAISEDQVRIVGETAVVSVTVSSSEYGTFTTVYMSFTYDADKLELNTKEIDGCVLRPGSGTLRVLRYGADLPAGTAFTLAFSCIAAGTAQVRIASARVDNSAGAESSDMPPAAVTSDTITVTVTEPPHGHSWGGPAWVWTETGTGFTAKAVFTCSECGERQEVDAEVTARTTDATCTEAGRVAYTASVRFGGQTYTDEKEAEIPALGHDWGPWTVTSEPTETAPGEDAHVCRRCHLTETRPVPPTGGSGAVTYEIYISGTEHGSVTARPRKAAAGEDVILTPVPDEGYELKEIAVTDADGNYTETQIPTLMNSGVISQIRFAKGDTNYETIYLRGLKYYTVESAFSNITVKTVDADGAALADVAVDVSGNTAVTNAVGVAKLTLPLGAYIASAAKDGYSASVGVMSMGINKVYTLTLGDTSVEPEPLITGIDRVNGNSIIVSTNGEGLRLYAAKYDNGVLKNIYAADAEEGTVLYNAGFEPDKVFLWDLNLTPFDKWEK